DAFVNWVNNTLGIKRTANVIWDQKEEFDFQIVDSPQELYVKIKQKSDEKQGSARLVSGFCWPWSNPNPDGTLVNDVKIGNFQMPWEGKDGYKLAPGIPPASLWPNDPNGVNQIGSIYTIQGFEFDYVGVIIGPDLVYNFENQTWIALREKSADSVVKRSGEKLVDLLKNTYRVLLTRGMKGCYVYFVDKETEKFFKSRIETGESYQKFVAPVFSPITLNMLRIPLVGSAPCGNPLLGQENIEEYISVEKTKIKPGFEYFVLRAEGDSMNLAGINDGDLVLCRQQLKADTGNRVVALLGDNVTIKMYDKKDWRRILLPKSTNKSHMPITPEEGDSVQGVVQEVLESGSE
ncbi:MAG: DNA/RNA helicase domain-containing protein, partial [Patescibacteria group bacterium]